MIKKSWSKLTRPVAIIGLCCATALSLQGCVEMVVGSDSRIPALKLQLSQCGMVLDLQFGLRFMVLLSLEFGGSTRHYALG